MRRGLEEGLLIGKTEEEMVAEPDRTEFLDSIFMCLLCMQDGQDRLVGLSTDLYDGGEIESGQ